MTAQPKVNSSKLLIAVLALFILAGGGLYYYFQCKTPDFNVTFSDSKEVVEGAGVFLAGVEVGRVVSVTPSGTGAAVGINLSRGRGRRDACWSRISAPTRSLLSRGRWLRGPIRFFSGRPLILPKG